MYGMKLMHLNLQRIFEEISSPFYNKVLEKENSAALTSVCVVIANKIYRFRKDEHMWQYVILYCNNLIIYVTKRHTRLLCGRWFDVLAVCVSFICVFVCCTFTHHISTSFRAIILRQWKQSMCKRKTSCETLPFALVLFCRRVVKELLDKKIRWRWKRRKTTMLL